MQQNRRHSVRRLRRQGLDGGAENRRDARAHRAAERSALVGAVAARIDQRDRHGAVRLQSENEIDESIGERPGG